jgi:two-component system, OmpR family, sensor kinase
VLDRFSIRWRLALTSAALTFLILCVFATTVGQLTASRVRANFNDEVAAGVDAISDRLQIVSGTSQPRVEGPVELFAEADNAVVRVLTTAGDTRLEAPVGAPQFGILERTTQSQGYRVETRRRTIPVNGSRTILASVVVQYARPISQVETTVNRIRLFLILGVLGGTGLALVGGLVVARRAMAPIAGLTATARDIARTRDPNLKVPVPDRRDEVGELAFTLDEMLQELEAAQEETAGALARQRQFVADASHELRTPLTSVLVNLELLVDVLDGERGEAARSALRSSRRMRRLVGDLLLLARTEPHGAVPHEPTDLAQVLLDAAAELEPVSEEHVLTVEARPAIVVGAPDDLHRLMLNLLENALRHTPAGTRVHASVGCRDSQALITVADDGPGVPEELRERIFERFVRGDGEASGSAGLGLAIVRAVAESHGGTVTVEDAEPGARFIVALPRMTDTQPDSGDIAPGSAAPAERAEPAQGEPAPA